MKLSEGEKLQAQRLYALGHPVQHIAKTLGRRVQDVHRACRPNGATVKRKLRSFQADLAELKLARQAAGLNEERMKVDADILAARDRRLAIPPRDLTAAILGDPRPGWSALDKRNQTP